MFNEYPYVNLQDVNLDWILKHIKDLETNLQDFIKLNTIKYADPIIWNITKQYESNTVVIDGNTGTAYISVQPVPAGVALTNTDYWTVVFTLNLTTSNQNITFRDDGTNVVATFASDTGDWLLWNFYLYRATQPISVNTAYVEGFNIERYTVELFIKDYLNELKNIVGDLDDLNTTDKNSIVDAINEVLGNVGDLNDLNTTNKDSAVDAINEVLGNVGDLNDLNTTDKDSAVDAINEVHGNVGDLNDLNTTDKDSAVDAINELVTSIGDVSNDLTDYESYMGAYVTPEMFGAVGDGIADDTQAIIDAITAGSVCLCSKNYYTSQPIIPPSRHHLIVNGQIYYHGNDCAIQLSNQAVLLTGIGMVVSEGACALKITSSRHSIENLTFNSISNFTACIWIESTSGDIVLNKFDKIKLYSRDSDNNYGIGLYLHTSGSATINENYYNEISCSFFEDALRIFNDSSNNMNRNFFTKFNAEGCTRHLYAYSTGATITDNEFNFRIEEFSHGNRIHIDSHVIGNKFKALRFTDEFFTVINPSTKSLYVGDANGFNIIEGFIATRGGGMIGYNGAFHINGDIVVFDWNSKVEGMLTYLNITLDYSGGGLWPKSFYKIGGSVTDWTLDLNYRSDWCTAPVERIQIMNAPGTDVTIKNDTTILFGPTHLAKGQYKVMYDTVTKNSISLVQLTTV